MPIPSDVFVGYFQSMPGPDITDWVIALVGGAHVWIGGSRGPIVVWQCSVRFNGMAGKMGLLSLYNIKLYSFIL